MRVSRGVSTQAALANLGMKPRTDNEKNARRYKASAGRRMAMTIQTSLGHVDLGDAELLGTLPC